MHIDNQSHITSLQLLFEKEYGIPATSVELVPPSGSDRIYFIMKADSKKAIGAYNPDLKENRTFFYFTELFLKHGMPVPKIYQKDSKGYYLIEYFEGKSLLEVRHELGLTPQVKQFFKQAIDHLIQFQWKVLEEIDYDLCHAAKEFNTEQIFADLQYFKYYFLDLQKLSYDRLALHNEFKQFAMSMSGVLPRCFMYRDFQSRNIIVRPNGSLGFIDYQGGMEGIPQYDFVSLLWQARAELPEDWKHELFNYYFDGIKQYAQLANINELEFRKVYLDCVLLRIIQTLGAYGFRGLIERKEHFIKSIVPALHQLRYFLDEYPRHPESRELRQVLEAITKPSVLERFEMPTTNFKEQYAQAPLTISIYSFSYKKGTALDTSGNGGGFVFDCRGILNPGRLEAYKPLTGMDKEVQDYLEQQTLMPTFLKNIHQVLDTTVENYLERGFEHLSISFGCTGGQHRSVYAALKTKAYLEEKYGLQQVKLIHLEQESNELERCNGHKLSSTS